jgi:hypothetical protein
MMAPVQSNFGYMLIPIITQGGIKVYPPPSQSVSFPAANTTGNGLVVVGYFRIGWPLAPPSLTVSDTNGNAYLPIGACSIYSPSSGWRSYLAAWYVQSCKPGSNTVTVTETWATGLNAYVLAASIFEYANGFGALDNRTWGTGLAQASISLSFSTSAANDLIFCYGVNEGIEPTVSVDASSSGFAIEQTEQINNGASPSQRIVELLAADKTASSSGVQSVTLDFAQTSPGGNTMFVAALPPSPIAPPPAPTPPPSPVSGSAAWPTIF